MVDESRPLATEHNSAGRPTLLTEELKQRICTFIRAGAYDWVAAQACGIGKSTFHQWMSRGQHVDTYGRPTDPIYQDFASAVLVARAQARLKAESTVASDDPKFWLRNGPGKTRYGEEGWTETVNVNTAPEVNGAAIMLVLPDGGSRADIISALAEQIDELRSANAVDITPTTDEGGTVGDDIPANWYASPEDKGVSEPHVTVWRTR